MHFDRDTKIAFLGMGLMGTRMATRLVQAGFEVRCGIVARRLANLCSVWGQNRCN